MTDRPPLDREAHDVMTAALEMMMKQFEDGGADPRSLAHALLPFALDRLLAFHAPDTLTTVAVRQVELLAYGDGETRH